MSQYNLGRSYFLIIIGGGVPGSFQAKSIFPPLSPTPSGTLRYLPELDRPHPSVNIPQNAAHEGSDKTY